MDGKQIDPKSELGEETPSAETPSAETPSAETPSAETPATKHCFRCSAPLQPGKELRVRRKSTGEHVLLCVKCVVELRRKRASDETQVATTGEPTATANAATADGATQTADRATPAVVKTSTQPTPPRGRRSIATKDGVYRPSNKFPRKALPILLLATLLGGLLGGGALATFARAYYVIIAFPLLMGLAAGWIVSKAVRLGKVRNPKLAAIFALATGLLFYSFYWGDDYVFFRYKTLSPIYHALASTPEAEPVVPHQVLDAYLIEETGQAGLPGYVLFTVQQGMSIALDRRGAPVNIGSTLTGLYYLAELGIIAAASIIIAHGAASRPFCEIHHRWYGAKKLVGGVGPAQADQALGLLQAGDYAALAQQLAAVPPIPGVAFYTQRCETCKAGEPVLTVSKLSYNWKGLNTKDLFSLVISMDQFQRLSQAGEPSTSL